MRKTDHPLYMTWAQIKTRCYNVKFQNYKYYGGKGITVCERWLNSFDNFLADMGEKPTPKHSLDRYPDKNGNYEPSNCRWATLEEQANNKKNTVYVEYEGEVMPVKLLCRKLKFDYTYMMRGIYNGMTAHEIIKAYDDKVKRNYKIIQLKKRAIKQK